MSPLQRLTRQRLTLADRLQQIPRNSKAEFPVRLQLLLRKEMIGGAVVWELRMPPGSGSSDI